MSEVKIPVVVDTVIEVRIVPATSCYIIEVVYEKKHQPQIDSTYVAGIDLGIDRLVAISTNKPGVKPMLVNGQPLKSVNQLYNKRKAKYQSVLKGQKKTSRKIEALTYHRNRFVENYLHNTSKLVVNYLVTNRIGIVVIGQNDNWKQGANIGKKNNQNFTQIPHSQLIQQITYKCQLAGVKVIETEESYTSKTSAIDLEKPCKHRTYVGKRVKRGLFRSATGIVINADVNGSLQI
ncbi:MAG: transposase [Trichodesmium sp. MO_231.B1]|nr:transposase [Trichodesmium sp. MO_231.B1]